MPRIARIVVPGYPHHITQRGNNRQDVFFVDDDRRAYLAILAEQAERYGLAVEGYCLMTNHIHLIATPGSADSLAKAVGRTHWLYTQYVNRLHGRCGHLWQNRFYSCGLDETHFWTAMVYVERNPVRARVVRKPWRYVWSSAAAHCGHADATGLLDLDGWARMLPRSGPEARRAGGLDGWREALCAPLDDRTLSRLRIWTHRGRPLGSDRFVAKLERLVGRRLRPLPVGRPRKTKNKQESRQAKPNNR